MARRRDTNNGMAAAKVVPVRLPDEVLTRVDTHRQRLLQLTGIEPSRSEVIKMLIERGLSAVEPAQSPITSQKKR